MAIIRPSSTHSILGIILLLGLTHGLLYVFLVPPWQHYDEPTHFEYAWLIANRAVLPQPDDFDQAMRREVAASMVEHGFFNGLNFRPNLLSETEPVWIGISELRHPPAYYWLVALPLRLVRFTDITFQLYIARLASLALYLLSIVCAWNVMIELVPSRHPLRWLVPTTMALLPGYTDLMTAVNSDVGAVVVFSLFLWGGFRLLRRGFSVVNFLWAAGIATLCAWIKETVLLALLLLPLFLLFSLLRGSRRWVAWTLLFAGTIAGIVALFSWDDAASWYRDTPQAGATRGASPQAPWGQYTLQIETAPAETGAPTVHQILPAEQVLALRDHTVTMGAWIWSSEPTQARTPILNIDGWDSSFYRAIRIGKEPTFYALSVVVPKDATRAWISLAPATASLTQVTVFYRGVVLAEGMRPAGEAPQFDDPQEEYGLWGGQPFHNLVRNGSAQDAWPRVRPWAESMGSQVVGGQPTIVLASLFDWRSAGWYYWETAQNMLRTFWGKFGWGHVPLLGDRPYRILAVLTSVGIAGVPLVLWRRQRTMPWEVVLLLGIALCSIWFAAMVRGTVESLFGIGFIPGARYAFPAIIPTLVVLNAGWLEILRGVGNRLHLPVRMPYMVPCLLFILLDVVALASILYYYSVH